MQLAFPSLSDLRKKAAEKPSSQPLAFCLQRSLKRPVVNQSIWKFIMICVNGLVNQTWAPWRVPLYLLCWLVGAGWVIFLLTCAVSALLPLEELGL